MSTETTEVKNEISFNIKRPSTIPGIIFFIMWIAGMVVAKGFWSTLFSIIFFPWGWYLVIEKILIANGLI